MPTELFPPVVMTAAEGALPSLARGISHFAVEDALHGAWAVWLRAVDGNVWKVTSTAVDVRPMFEVCTLVVEPTPTEAIGDWRDFRAKETALLRRAEFVVEGDGTGERFGGLPHLNQSAARPGFVPGDAISACEVDVGVLFGDGDARLLVGAHWFPLRLVVSMDAPELEEFLQDCAMRPLEDLAAS